MMYSKPLKTITSTANKLTRSCQLLTRLRQVPIAHLFTQLPTAHSLTQLPTHFLQGGLSPLDPLSGDHRPRYTVGTPGSEGVMGWRGFPTRTNPSGSGNVACGRFLLVCPGALSTTASPGAPHSAKIASTSTATDDDCEGDPRLRRQVRQRRIDRLAASRRSLALTMSAMQKAQLPPAEATCPTETSAHFNDAMSSACISFFASPMSPCFSCSRQLASRRASITTELTTLCRNAFCAKEDLRESNVAAPFLDV